jgi:hypothetical protein
MVSDFCFLNFKIFYIIIIFLSFIGEGYIMVGEKVIALQFSFLFLISDNFRGNALMIFISYYCCSKVKFALEEDEETLISKRQLFSYCFYYDLISLIFEFMISMH